MGQKHKIKLERLHGRLLAKKSTGKLVVPEDTIFPQAPPWSSTMKQRCQVVMGIGISCLAVHLVPSVRDSRSRAIVPTVLLCQFWVLASWMLGSATNVSDWLRAQLVLERSENI